MYVSQGLELIGFQASQPDDGEFELTSRGAGGADHAADCAARFAAKSNINARNLFGARQSDLLRRIARSRRVIGWRIASELLRVDGARKRISYADDVNARGQSVDSIDAAVIRKSQLLDLLIERHRRRTRG